jgi:hypothetical protein
MNAPRALNSVIFDQIAGVIGSEAAHALCARFGGTELYVPKTMTAGHRIARAIGFESATILSKHFTGEELVIPKQPRRRARVLELYRRGGMTRAQIALATDFTERHVNSIIAKSRDDRQGDLFVTKPRK